MPIFDVACDVCGYQRPDTLVRGEWPAHCGQPMTKLWTGRFPNVIDDSIPGGLVIENITATPITVYSKSEHRRVMKEHGVSPMVRHVGEQGSDKSRHTQRWI